MDNVILRRRQCDRGGKRPVTFYLPSEHSKKMATTQNRRSLSDITLNEAAMLSCWRKVHGGSHSLENRKSETIEEESVLELTDGLPPVDSNSNRLVSGNADRPMKPKTAASRQSSFPGLRERTLIQNEAKRLSMPLPVIYRKEMAQRQFEQLEKASVKVEAVTDVVRVTETLCKTSSFGTYFHLQS